jgi:hypothetical protein
VLIPKSVIVGVGTLMFFRDTEGNAFGAIQFDKRRVARSSRRRRAAADRRGSSLSTSSLSAQLTRCVAMRPDSAVSMAPPLLSCRESA